uniref:Uncharacterized protein n=1 Tax=Amphimedon queenslandica TaxID=400682 RepID=A0A1X7ST52_AMPQE
MKNQCVRIPKNHTHK